MVFSYYYNKMLEHSIKISEATYRSLKERGIHGETFNDIIQKLLEGGGGKKIKK